MTHGLSEQKLLSGGAPGEFEEPTDLPLRKYLRCGQRSDAKTIAERGGRLVAWSALALSISLSGCAMNVDPAFCGGIAGIPCDKAQYCMFETGVCGAGDQGGVCAVIPDVCIELFDPVCGCDGKTYSNTCNAAQAGISVMAQGECSSQ